MLRVLHCVPNMGGGGAERQLMLLAAAQTAAGADVHVALLRGGPNADGLGATGATTHTLPASGNHDPRIVLRIARLARRVRPTVLQTWLPQMDVFGGAAALATRTPWVLSERASGAAYQERVKDRFLRRSLGRLASAVVANSDAGADYWRHVAPSVPAFVIPNIVATADIATAAPVDLAQFGIAPGTPVVLLVGRLVAQKNVDFLLRALPAVFARIPGAALICGQGPEREPLEALATSLGIAERVHFLGYRRDVWGLMKSASVVTNVSRYEGQPNAVIEALAAGRPVVVSDIPEHRALVPAASARVAPDDVPRLSDALIAALARGAAGPDRSDDSPAPELCTADRAADLYAAVYARVLAPTRNAPELAVTAGSAR